MARPLQGTASPARPGEPGAPTGTGAASLPPTLAAPEVPLRTRAARGTLVNGVFTIALGALSLLKSFVLAGFLSRADYGVWGILIITVSTLLWLKQVGIGDKYIQQQEADQERAFQKALTIELGLSLGLALVLLALVPVLVLAYHLPRLILPALVVALTVLVSALQAPQWIFLRRMDYVRQRTLAAVDPVVGFVVSLGLAVAGAGYWAFVGGLAAGAFCSTAVSALACPYPLRLRYEPGTLRGYVSFSAPLLAASVAVLVMSWATLITAKLSLGIAAVGVVTLAATIQSFTDSADQVVTGALYPAICAVRDRMGLLQESFVKSNRLALMWAVPFGVGLTLFAADLVRFGIGERWRPAVIVLELYGVAAALNHVGFNWTAYLRARGETRPIAVAACAAAGSFLLVGLPLLVLTGLGGFAVGVVVQGLVSFALRVLYLRRLFPSFAPLAHIARAFLPTVPAAAAVLVARALESGGRSAALAAGELVLYVAVTAAATWWLEGSLLREAVAIARGRTRLVAGAA